MRNEIKEFTNELIEALKNRLPEGYKTEVVTEKKLNKEYEGIIVMTNESNMSPTMNLEKLYESYKDNLLSMDAICNTFIAAIKRGVEFESLEAITKNYDIAKKHLYIRVSSAERNREFLVDHPHTIVEDLAITYHICIEKNTEETASFPISNDLLCSYGIDVETLHKDALDNAPKLFPVCYENMFNCMTIITNQERTNGAACVFYPGVLEGIARECGSYYLLPSSIHEFIIAEEDTGDADEFVNMVKEINANPNVISSEDILTDNAYHYDACEHIFETADNYKKRML